MSFGADSHGLSPRKSHQTAVVVLCGCSFSLYLWTLPKMNTYSVQYCVCLVNKGSTTGSVQATDRLMKELREIYRSHSFKQGNTGLTTFSFFIIYTACWASSWLSLGRLLICCPMPDRQFLQVSRLYRALILFLV